MKARNSKPDGSEPKKLKGKVALITGGAKRLGRETALALAQEGTDVAITFLKSAHEARNTVVAASRLGVRALAVECDVRDLKSVQTAVSDVVSELGGLDLLVNNAGFYETIEFEKLTVERWDNVFAVNARGPFLVSQCAAPHLRKRNGRIVNLGSLGGERPWATHAHYCSSKAAVIMLTRVMAKALAPEIAVNCVSPGMIDLGEKSAAAFFRKTASRTPVQRNGTAADVAAAILFFASAPHFITGQALTVDGGLGLV